HNNRAIILLHRGRTKKALAACRRALVLNPDQAETYTNLGNVLVKLGQLDQAIEAFRKSISLKPDDRTYYPKHLGMRPDVAAYFCLGTALQAKKSWEESVEALREADRRMPDNGGILTELGASLFGAGELDEARRVLEAAVRRDDKLWQA